MNKAAQVLLELHRQSHKPPESIDEFGRWLSGLQGMYATYKMLLGREQRLTKRNAAK